MERQTTIKKLFHEDGNQLRRVFNFEQNKPQSSIL